TPGATSAAGLPGGVATSVAPPTLNGGNSSTGTTAVPIAPVTPETTLAQTSTDGDASSNQNNGNANTPSGNTAANAALNSNTAGSLAVNANAAATTTPDLAVSNTANLNVTPLTNANPVGTDVSARLNPAGITDANAGNDALNAARLTRGLNNAVNQQGGSVTLRLTPPEMGTVRIQLNLQGTNVSAQFHAETDSAQRLLTQQLGQLRTSLESQGLNVERLGVQSISASSNSSSLQQQTNSDNPQSQANADGRSRGNAGGNAGGQSSQQSGSGGDDADAASNSFTQLLDPDREAEAGTLTAV
ncbi:MAG: flagellar hook-length control protein FliK, partial [Planctomycetota bacterium]